MKLTGPFMSLEASGSFANTITAALWRGRQVVKKKPNPRQPRTVAQRIARARIGHLKAFWRNLTDINDELIQEEWAAFNPDPSISAFNYYIRWNLERYAAGLAPKYFPTFNSSNGDQNQYVGVTPGIRQIAWTSNETNANETVFGTRWYLQTVLGTPAPNELVWISGSTYFLGSPYSVVLKYIEPGTYYLWSETFYGDGTVDGSPYSDTQPYTVTS